MTRQEHAMKKSSFLLTGCLATLLAAAGMSADDKSPAPTPKEAEALDQKTDQLVSQLDNDEWSKRQTATEELVKMGVAALPKLKEAFINSYFNNETHYRVRTILNTIVPPPPPPAPPHVSFHGNINAFNTDGTLKRIDPVSATTNVQDLVPGFGVRIEATLDLFCVTDLRADSAADKMGIKVGDFIRKVNGQPLAVLDDVKKALSELPPNAPLELEIRRTTKTLTLKIKQ
jgi:hypothetical protein